MFEAIIMFIASELVVDRPTINKPKIKYHEITGNNLKAVSLAFYVFKVQKHIHHLGFTEAHTRSIINYFVSKNPQEIMYINYQKIHLVITRLIDISINRGSLYFDHLIIKLKVCIDLTTD